MMERESIRVISLLAGLKQTMYHSQIVRYTVEMGQFLQKHTSKGTLLATVGGMDPEQGIIRIKEIQFPNNSPFPLLNLFFAVFHVIPGGAEKEKDQQGRMALSRQSPKE